MKRWQLTLGLVGLALLTAGLAPRLLGAAADNTTTPPPELPPLIPEVHEEMPRASGPLVLTAGVDAAALLGPTSERLVVLTVSAPGDVDAVAQPPAHLSVLIDTSGSMMAEQRLEYAKRAAIHLVGQLRPEDTFSLVTFSDRAKVVVRPGPVTDPHAVQRLISTLTPSGGTNLNEGLTVAAAQVAPAGKTGLPAQVLLLSDGQATSGNTSSAAMLSAATSFARDGVSLSAFGLGLDFNEDLLTGLADNGGGTYAYIRSPADIEPAFAKERARTSTLVARQAELTLRAASGVRLLEVLDWSANATSDGWRVYLGDHSAGQTRKIVARVAVTPAALGAITLIDADLRYHDQLAERSARTTAAARTSVVATEADVRASVNASVAATATQALGWSQLKQASAAYESGRRQQASALAATAQQTLIAGATDYDMPELQHQADSVDKIRRQYEQAPAASPAGRHLLKMSKEASRDNSR